MPFHKLVVPHFKHISFVSLTSLFKRFLTNCSKLFQPKQIVDFFYIFFNYLMPKLEQFSSQKRTFFLLHHCELHPPHYRAYVCRRDPLCVTQERQPQFHGPNHLPNSIREGLSTYFPLDFYFNT